MPDRPDNPINDTPPGTSFGLEQRVDHISTHQHLDTDALSAFIDDRLKGDLSLAAAGHIASCSDCRRELAELRATVSLLHGLPQYRPRRSFALSQDYAHPVRTSRFARFLPLLPRLQAATVACLLLLLVVGAGDVLTQIGEDSNDTANPSSEAEQVSGDTAFQPDQAAGEAGQPESGMVTGDGTGGDTGNAGFAGASEPKPETGSGNASQSDESALDEAPPDDAPGAGMSADAPMEESDTDIASDSESISAASAPESAESGGVNDADTSGADEESLGMAADAGLGEAASSAEDADAADSAAAGGSGAAREPAAAAAGADAPPADAAAETASDDGRSSNALPAPTTGTGGTDPVPTIGIATEAPSARSEGEVAQADASGAAPAGRQSGSASDSGISNWRLIEIVLVVVLIALAALVVVLHRLNARARRIGIIR